jgi:hypothetical protein
MSSSIEKSVMHGFTVSQQDHTQYPRTVFRNLSPTADAPVGLHLLTLRMLDHLHDPVITYDGTIRPIAGV